MPHCPLGALGWMVGPVSERAAILLSCCGGAVVSGDVPSSRPRLVFDDPFRIVGYVSEPAREIGILLWTGIDPQRYFRRHNQSEVESFKHLLTLDYAGQVVAWQSKPANEQKDSWLEVQPEIIENLNRYIRDIEALRYRPSPAAAS